LSTLHVPCNRLLLLDFLEELTELNELVAAENDLEEIPSIINKFNISVVDLSFNNIKFIDNLNYYPNLEDLYLTNNKINDMLSFENVKCCSNLKSIHLFGNNVAKIPSYKMKLREILPDINTIDAD
jgi:protein phosphatase 1 regulatory subunit 7